LTAALIGLPVLYVASFGPACWITSRANCGVEIIDFAFQPLMRLARNTPWWFAEILDGYAELGAAPDWMVLRNDTTPWCHSQWMRPSRPVEANPEPSAGSGLF